MFRTEIHPASPPFRIDLNHSLVTVGSCFSDVMGHYLRANKFSVLINPFGTQFHPGILCGLLQMALQNQYPNADTFLNFEGRWVSYLLHSSINASSEEALRDKIQTIFEEVNTWLLNADVLIITAGTGFLYRHDHLDLGVANCHKQPQKLFKKELSSPDELSNTFGQFVTELQAKNPSLKIVLTISPVRHLKDSLELNSVSKAILRLFAHRASESHPNVSYFPSYELLLDDLRDYRFYGRDLLHPSQEAEDYIWQKFAAAYMGDNAKKFIAEWQQIRNALNHRPFNPTSEAHQQFIRKTIQKLEQLPYKVNANDEIAQLKSQLND